MTTLLRTTWSSNAEVWPGSRTRLKTSLPDQGIGGRLAHGVRSVHWTPSSAVWPSGSSLVAATPSCTSQVATIQRSTTSSFTAVEWKIVHKVCLSDSINHWKSFWFNIVFWCELCSSTVTVFSLQMNERVISCRTIELAPFFFK